MSKEPLFTQKEPKHVSVGSPLDLETDLHSAGWHAYKTQQYIEKLALLCSHVNKTKSIEIKSDELRCEIEELQYFIDDFLPNLEEFIGNLGDKETAIIQIFGEMDND